MSADNGIYIGDFADGYRVIHAQAIENCEGDDELTDAYIHVYFKDAKVFSFRDDAWAEARRIYDEMSSDEDIFILEYGISEITFPFKFPVMTDEEVRRIMGPLY